MNFQGPPLGSLWTPWKFNEFPRTPLAAPPAPIQTRRCAHVTARESSPVLGSPRQSLPLTGCCPWGPKSLRTSYFSDPREPPPRPTRPDEFPRDPFGPLGNSMNFQGPPLGSLWTPWKFNEFPRTPLAAPQAPIQTRRCAHVTARQSSLHLATPCFLRAAALWAQRAYAPPILAILGSPLRAPRAQMNFQGIPLDPLGIQ